MTAQAELFDVPSHGVDDQTRSLLELIAGDPRHAEDRQRIVAAIVRDAREHGGKVNMNRVRPRLESPQGGGFVVYPRVIGAVVGALASRGALVPVGFITNEDRRSGNAGRPMRAWRLVLDVQIEIPTDQLSEATS